MVLSQCMQNEKDKKMTEYFKSKNFLEKFLCLMIELNEKERLHMPTWEDQTVFNEILSLCARYNMFFSYILGHPMIGHKIKGRGWVIFKKVKIFNNNHMEHLL